MPLSTSKSQLFYTEGSSPTQAPVSTKDVLGGGWKSSFNFLTSGVLFLLMIGLVIVVCIKVQKNSACEGRMMDLIKTGSDTASDVKQQITDVLIPLFKVIGEEVGIRLPETLQAIKRDIATKVNFFNPNQKFEFKELQWCVNPPEEVKVDFDQYCAKITLLDAMTNLFSSTKQHFVTEGMKEVTPQEDCKKGLTLIGARHPSLLDWTTMGRRQAGSVNRMKTVIADGHYGKTYLLAQQADISDLAEVTTRVFEIGLIRSWPPNNPTFLVTNYIMAPLAVGLNYCLLAVGNMVLAALCSQTEEVRVPKGGEQGKTQLTGIRLPLYGSIRSSVYQVIEVPQNPISTTIYISDSRGLIISGNAVWTVPAKQVHPDLRTTQCLDLRCKGTNGSHCQEGLSAGGAMSSTASYGILYLRVDPTLPLRLIRVMVTGPLNPVTSRFDMYPGEGGAKVMITTQPQQETTLGGILSLDFGSSLAITPVRYYKNVKYSGGSCEVPEAPPAYQDNTTVISSNIVMLPYKGGTYITAEYDKSRGEDAVVYYIKSLVNQRQFMYPFKYGTNHHPTSLRLECFPWGGKIWCHHSYSVEVEGGARTQLFEDFVSISIHC